MYLTVVHHPKAGRGEYSRARLCKALRDAGHQVRYFKKDRGNNWKKGLAGQHEVVVVAGGDGTVAKVARCLVGRKIPLAVLPLGTANNLARTLGFAGSVQKLITQFETATPRALDVGVARGPWGSSLLFEGAGGGLLADYMSAARNGKHLSRREELRAHVVGLHDLLKRFRARTWKIWINGQRTTSDRYLFFEALNTAFVGPSLRLAPAARMDDGQFDLVLARENDRELLNDYLAARIASGRQTPFPLPAQRFKTLRIQCSKMRLHLDSKLEPPKKAPTRNRLNFRLEVQSEALIVLSKS